MVEKQNTHINAYQMHDKLEILLVALKLLIVTIGYYVLQFLDPMSNFVWGLIIMVIVDFVLGIMGAKRKGEEITLDKGLNSIAKYFLYFFALIAANTFDMIVLTELVGTKTSFVFVIGTAAMWDELVSIFRHVGTLSGSKSIINIADAMPKYFGIRVNILEFFKNKNEKK